MSFQKKHLEIRRLRAADARTYRSVLVEALIVHPDRFSDDYGAEVSRPLSEVEQELERSGTFGAWFGGTLAGIGSGTLCTGLKRKHCGRIRNLYVRQQFRHKGIAGLLLHEILRCVAKDVEQLEAEVPAPFEDVVRLFEQSGFRMCGLVPSALRIGREEVDVWTMIRVLR